MHGPLNTPTDDSRQIEDASPESSDARPRCNALTVSQRRAISRLIARKRSTVSNVPCPVEFNRPLCCLCGANFVTGRLIVKPGRCGKHRRRFSHYCSIFIVSNKYLRSVILEFNERLSIVNNHVISNFKNKSTYIYIYIIPKIMII